MYPRMRSLPTVPTANILDAMAIVQMLRFAGASTFGEMAAKYFEVLASYYQQGCHRLEVVFDQYSGRFLSRVEKGRNAARQAN